ncbi:hypothetical protein DPMN_159499 [Dreissena polymorpha]|uniref:Uncharacterized protein n=1 Tax=Dreissena polymorpha TaxID=45954 RepID=A0A9D4EKR0_DREPO|nr:hypothetical protein DPMN_159499 [Dreissena polymorpha]
MLIIIIHHKSQFVVTSFRLTNAKVNVIASDLWKFQRYALIENFKNRLTLPPPLTFINLTFIFLKYVYRKCYAKCKECYHPEVRAGKKGMCP